MKKKKLIFKKEYGSAILEGRKTATIRLTSRVRKGDTVDIIAGKIKIGTAMIEDVEIKKLKELTDNDATIDGFKNREELIRTLKKIYRKKINDNSEVKLIKFKLIGRNE
ncbi:MAG: ASCH domain-containing protein [Desulfurococcales archaeon]|nr:ASCH domain-containing protein [Desulfurococcales archaeon]